MNHLFRKRFCVTILLAAFAAMQLHAGPKPPTDPDAKEQYYIAQLQDSASTEKIVVNAMAELESLHKKDVNRTNAVPVLKKLLADSREPVRSKAGRVLAVFHASLDENDISELRKQLKSDSWKEVQEALKAIRDFAMPVFVPDILPCLKNSNAFVVRDACRTLAVIGNKDVIPQIEPLLKDPNPKIQEDAQNAIAQLKNR